MGVMVLNMGRGGERKEWDGDGWGVEGMRSAKQIGRRPWWIDSDQCGWIGWWVGMSSVNPVVDQMFQLVGRACDQKKI